MSPAGSAVKKGSPQMPHNFHMFPRTCAGIAIESQVDDIEDDTHDVKIEGRPLISQKHAQPNNYIKLVDMVGKALWGAGVGEIHMLIGNTDLWA